MAVETERARQPGVFQPDRSQQSILQKNRKASDKAVSVFLSHAGLDLMAFGTLHSSIVAQSKALKRLASLGDFFPYPSFSLGTPFLIWTTPLGPISDSAAVPFGSTFSGGSTRGAPISAGVSLTKTQFAVPPGKVVVFEVALAIDYENDDGNIEADFESGAFKIACPVVVFSLLNMPPGAMA